MWTFLEFVMKSWRIYLSQSVSLPNLNAGFSNASKSCIYFNWGSVLLHWKNYVMSYPHPLISGHYQRLYSWRYCNIRRDSPVHFLLLVPLTLHLFWALFLSLRNAEFSISVRKLKGESMECFITVSSMPYLELNVSSGRAVQLIQLKFLLSNCPMGNAVHTQAAERSVLTYRKKKCSFSVCFYSAVAVVFFFFLCLPVSVVTSDFNFWGHVCLMPCLHVEDRCCSFRQNTAWGKGEAMWKDGNACIRAMNCFKVGMCFLDCASGSVSKIANSSELAVCLKAVVFRIMVDAFQIDTMSFSFTCCYYYYF